MTSVPDGPTNGKDAPTRAPAVLESAPIDTVPSKPATEADLDKVEERMSGFERSTLRWTRASFVVVLATGLFICLQWLEMRSGGKDTHDLAVAAGKQADRMQDFADRMKDQADRTQELAEQAKAQVAAAKRSADTAHEALTRSYRPWVGVESMRIIQPIGFIKAGDAKDPTYFVDGSVQMIVKNFGSSPALSVHTFFEAYDPSVFKKEKLDPKEPFAELRKFGESTCALANGNEFTKKRPKMFGGSIFPTEGITYTSGIPGFAKREFQVGQFIQLVGCIVYRDQFGERTHYTHYCFVAPVGKTGEVNNCESNSDAD